MQQDNFKKHIIFSLIVVVAFILLQAYLFWNAFAKGKENTGILPFIFLSLTLFALAYSYNVVLKAIDKNRLKEIIDGEVSKERSKILQDFEQKIEEEQEDKSTVDINSKVRSIVPKGNFKSLDTLFNKYIKNLASELEMVQGISYVKEENDDEYKFLSGFAISGEDTILGFKAGETLCGQVTKTREIAYITDIPEDYFKIETGLGGSKPNQIIIAPIISNDEVVCIIEMSFFKTFDEISKQILQKSIVEISGKITQTIKS